MKSQFRSLSNTALFFLTIWVFPLRSDDFEGIYRIGNRECRVKPIKMAFEVFCKPAKNTEIYFYGGEEDNGNRIFQTDNGASSSRFVFDDASLKTGILIQGDGKRWKVKKK
ncbi:hypothetical protein JWG45_05170 [Leptospira sp. 201903070]|uniref:DUF2147 domain-containing protein n=1 Tax=Leptospira ainlahdjerensis TaxID=2810033 RepID=A0ABS2U845_9LEPT|nr:hypothetical protein [Leptospira ainlahdjerensis]MBM9576541.1 hypothetical protein [Leptospira ainlahdjerensis]